MKTGAKHTHKQGSRDVDTDLTQICANVLPRSKPQPSLSELFLDGNSMLAEPLCTDAYSACAAHTHCACDLAEKKDAGLSRVSAARLNR